MALRKQKLREKVCKVAERILDENGGHMAFSQLCYFVGLEADYPLTYKQFAQYLRACKGVERVVVRGKSYYILKNQDSNSNDG